MFSAFNTIEKAKGLIGLIVILGLGYYAYPYDSLSLLLGAITILLIARLFWYEKMNKEAYTALEMICVKGDALIIQEEYRHRILNPDLYNEFDMRASPLDRELYYVEIENDEYLIVPNKTIENNDMEILDYGIYSKIHDIWIARGCATSGADGPSDKTSYWLCDEDLTLMMPIYTGYRNVINVKKFLNIFQWMTEDKLHFYSAFKKSTKRKNYF